MASIFYFWIQEYNEIFCQLYFYVLQITWVSLFIILFKFFSHLKEKELRGAWVAKSVKCPTLISAHVMIAGLWD